MAAYYHGGSEIQGEGLQTLYLMNPGYVGYSSDAPAVTTQPSAAAAANMVILNSNGNPIASPGNLGHLHQHNPPFFGIPLQATVAAPPPQDVNPHALAPLLQYNLWPGPAAQNQQRLSLSLSPQQASYSGYRAQGSEMAPAPALDISPASAGGDEAPRMSGSTSSTSGVSNGMAGINHGVLMGSKYLKAAQVLLDEVVNVGVEIKDEKMKAPAPATKGSDDDPKPSPPEENSCGEASGKRAAELMTTAERQELQMKKAKLVNMLDEVMA